MCMKMYTRNIDNCKISKYSHRTKKSRNVQLLPQDLKCFNPAL